MARYNHNFNDGDMVRDTEYMETFIFSDRSDGFRAQENPDKLRHATAEEIAAYKGADAE
jgi:hypothetical protein